jgi:hypothetical protein
MANFFVTGPLRFGHRIRIRLPHRCPRASNFIHLRRSYVNNTQLLPFVIPAFEPESRKNLTWIPDQVRDGNSEVVSCPHLLNKNVLYNRVN